MNTIESYPLHWPDGWEREKNPQSSRFGKWNAPITVNKAVRFLLEELKRLGVRDGIGQDDVIISTNLKLRLDGLPYSNQRQPDETGVSVWWYEGTDQRVIAIDKYNRVADNIYAVAKTIEALRGIERWGSGEILQRTFKGFAALPNPACTGWRSILNCESTDINEIKACYKKMRAMHHPDKGGDAAIFNQVQQAWLAAQKELTSQGS